MLGRKWMIVTAGFCGMVLALQSQPLSHVTNYDEKDGLPHGHVTQLLQDGQGFMWFATWNGLCRFDGYEFHTFKSQAGDGCRMGTDRFRDIALRPDGKIICQVDNDYFLFDTHTCRFSNLTAEESRQAAEDIKHCRMSKSLKDEGKASAFTYTDRQGNVWTAQPHGIAKQTTSIQRTVRLDIHPQAQVKCLFTDSRGRYWVCTRDDAAVRIYSGADDHLMGYLGRDGQIHTRYTRFGSPVYCMFQSQDGTLWLGTKPDGLYRLREKTEGTFKIDHFTDISCPNIYSILEDRYGHLWVATLDGGLCYTTEPQAERPRFFVPKGYPKDAGQRLRHLHLAQNGEILVGAATDALVVAKVEPDADRMLFRLHRRESDRLTSLSSSAIIDMAEDSSGLLFIGTESGGMNSTAVSSLLSDTLSFRHFTASNHMLPNDVIQSLTPLGNNRMMVVSNHLISILGPQGVERVLDSRYFNSDYRFSDAHPQSLSGQRWLFGLTDGAFTTSVREIYLPAYQPNVVLTGVSIQGGADRWAVAYTDTLTLQPHERSLTIHFAALDYSAPDRIYYAFRLLPHEQWSHIGHNHSTTLLDLQPGTYQMEIRSTNADGQWVDNVRRLTIVVQPTFWETPWARLLLLLLIVAVLSAVAYTFIYIRRIKRQQRETLDAYLALLNGNEKEDTPQAAPATKLGPDDEVFMQRIIAFTEQHLADSDASIGDMAQAVAVSRSGLQRKLKHLLGVTPQDFLREARIKRACQLLQQSGRSVADVAYACGFTDPKYFSRCFKQSTGSTPSEYKNASM